MAAEIELFCDIVNRRLVTGLNLRDAFQVPHIYQGDQIAFRVWPVKPTNTVLAPFYSKQVIDNFTLQFNVGARAGAESLLVSQTSWTKVYDSGSSGTGYLSATVNFNTTNLNNAISTSDSYSTFLEIKLAESGVERVIWQQQLTIIACVQGPGSSAALPSPAADYFTKSDVIALLAQCVKYAGNPNGATLTFNSPDGGSQRTLGVNNDKSAQDDLV
jgi:hypothetical protein